ncbi:tumor suppressor candidate 3 [Ixodes scapularis]
MRSLRPRFWKTTANLAPFHLQAYIHSSSGGQLIVETYIVIALNVAVVFGMILMNDVAESRGDPKKRKIMAVVGLLLMSVFFSFLLSIFRSKAHGYPYSFLFKGAVQKMPPGSPQSRRNDSTEIRSSQEDHFWKSLSFPSSQHIPPQTFLLRLFHCT